VKYGVRCLITVVVQGDTFEEKRIEHQIRLA